ncbi:MAG: helix-turn-helix transcriptional regulator [Thermoleophilia bacterium]
MEARAETSLANVLSPEETLDITGALGDPTRYAIYRAIVDAAGDPLTVSQVAKEFSLHPNVARMHLQKLVDVGLVVTDTRRSKGGGRPARIYTLSRRVASLQFPPRDYQLLATLALDVISGLTAEQPELLDRVGGALGREEGQRALRRDGLDPTRDEVDALIESLRRTAVDLGLYPHIERRSDGTVDFEVRNCVFRELSSRHPSLVCRLHTAMLQGLVEEFLAAFQLEGTPSISTGAASCRFTLKLSDSATLG